MVKWSFAFAAIVASLSVVSAFNSPQRQPQQKQQKQSFFFQPKEETTKAPLSTPEAHHTTTPTLEEELVAKLVSTADQHFGKKKRDAYRTTLENIRDSKARSQRRLNRSALDKQYADDKLAKMMAKYQAKKKLIQDELEAKTMEASLWFFVTPKFPGV
jgi:hypothetical protein